MIIFVLGMTKKHFNMKLIIITLLLISSFAFSQSTSYTFPRIKSNITVPVSISVPEINKLINNTVTGVLYEDKSFTDNNNDQFKTKVEKDGNIKLTALKDNRLLIEVPLKIWAEKGYGTLGKYIYNDTNFNITMKFITSVEFKNNWTLETKTKTYGFEWGTKPVLDYGSIKIPIASLIEETLTEQQQKFTKVIDDKIKDSFDLKPYLLLVWNQFNAPINISPEYKTWLKLTPQTVYMSPIIIYKDYIKGSIALDLFSETFIGQIPASSIPIKTFPNYTFKSEIPYGFNLQTTASISFAEATNLAKTQFLNKEFVLTSEKNKVKITDVKVYSENQLIVIEAQTTGEVSGTSIIKGIPVYDEINHKIVLSNIDFKLKTKNLFQKAVATLFEGKIRKMIGEQYGIPMQEIEISSKQSLEDTFNKEYYPGIFLKGSVLDLKPSKILLFDSYLTLIIDTKAKLQMDVNGLNF